MQQLFQLVRDLPGCLAVCVVAGMHPGAEGFSVGEAEIIAPFEFDRLNPYWRQASLRHKPLPAVRR